MKGKLVVYVMFLLVFLYVLPLFSYAMRDFIEVYNFLPSNFPDNYIKSIMNKHTYLTFITKVDPPNALSWILIGMFSFYYIGYILGAFKPKGKYEQVDSYGSHGTARWQTEQEIKKNYYKNDLGWFLGSMKEVESYSLGMEAAYQPVDSMKNMQVNVVAPPGKFKTTGLVYPNLFHLPYAYKKRGMTPPDFIVIDPKSEIFCETADSFEKNDYDVFVLDFINLKYGNSLNPVDFVTEEKELMEVAKNYIISVEQSEGNTKLSGDRFWRGEAAMVLGALIGYTQQKLPPENQTITDVLEILTSEHIADVKSAKQFFKNSGITGAPMQLWKNFLMVTDSDRTRANILGTLSEYLSLFAISGIQNITNSTTVDIKKLGAKKDKPMILYIMIPDEDKTFSPVINMVVSSCFTQMYKTARLYRNKLSTPVYTILEEMDSVGYISGLREKLGSMRSRRIYPMMIWQDLGQMLNKYGEAWESVLAKCDTKLYLGAGDKFTAKYISDTLGPTTIKIQGISKKKEGIMDHNGTTVNDNYGQKPLIFFNQVMEFDLRKMIMSQIGEHPAQLYKVPYRGNWDGYEKYKICETKSVFDLPLLKTIRKNVELDLTVNKITRELYNKDILDKEHHEDLINEVAAVTSDIDNDNVVDLSNVEVSFSIDDLSSINIEDEKNRDF